MPRLLPVICVLLLSAAAMSAQTPTYIGAGGFPVSATTSSSEYTDSDRYTDTARSSHTIDGSGMNAEYFEAARFLQQATMGHNDSTTLEVVDMGMEAWIDDQFVKDTSYLLPVVHQIHQDLNDSIWLATMDSTELRRRPVWREFNYGWWHVNMTNEDLLRHKVAVALSEILVISRKSDLSGFGDGMASYYDVLLKHAFGNYRDLIGDVSRHPAMGFYLTHVNNPKTNVTENTQPDENYARELMQLFTIGLYELNIDGSRIISGGQEVPTYDQDDIRELSKVFTGYGFGGRLASQPGNLRFGMGMWNADVTIPMLMYDEDDPSTSGRDEDQHEDGNKTLFDTEIVYANASGEHEVDQALDIIFDRPSVAPFVAYRLIQRLTTSNPSPAYVTRVAQAFNNNGSGVKGDMKAVIKAILLDPEVRDCSALMDDHRSRLKAPFHRYTHMARMIDKENANNNYWNIVYNFAQETRQDLMASPSVFNFYLPTDTPLGPISDAGLVAPEFTLHDARTSIGYINVISDMMWQGRVMEAWENLDNRWTWWDLSEPTPIIQDPEAYVNWLDKRFTYGMMSDETRAIIRRAQMHFNEDEPSYQEWRVRQGLYLTLISPDYAVFK